jgi:hypothetical protein
MPKASMLSRRQWVVLTDFCLHPLPQSPLSLINVKSENTFFQNYYHIHRNKKNPGSQSLSIFRVGVPTISFTGYNSQKATLKIESAKIK